MGVVQFLPIIVISTYQVKYLMSENREIKQLQIQNNCPNHYYLSVYLYVCPHVRIYTWALFGYLVYEKVPNWVNVLDRLYLSRFICWVDKITTVCSLHYTVG